MVYLIFPKRGKNEQSAQSQSRASMYVIREERKNYTKKYTEIIMVEKKINLSKADR